MIVRYEYKSKRMKKIIKEKTFLQIENNVKEEFKTRKEYTKNNVMIK